jgi:translation initiation factor 2 subunit 3
LQIRGEEVIEVAEKPIPELNIGLVGHVDHGKTTLTQALTGKWADTHSEELKRGITIRLGYADAVFYFCKKCNVYCTSPKCPHCFGETKTLRAASFVDAPGHETLMATVLSGASLMDGAILLIAANESCPQPQTAEHLKALDIVGIKNIVIAQNKIDLVTEKEAIENYEQIKAFVKGTVAENAPIIPISASHNVNISPLIEAIEKHIPTPKRDMKKKPKFYVARSFDINRPGTDIAKLKGGVIGGSITQGVLEKGQEIEIRPGTEVEGKWQSLKTKIISIRQSQRSLEKATSGGLIALETGLDPALTRSDNLTGNLVGLVGKLPPVFHDFKMKFNLFDHVIGIRENIQVKNIKTNDVLMMTVAIAKTVGIVTSAHKNVCEIKLKLPICAEKGDKVAISKQVGGRWHLIGYGEIL